MHTGSVEQSLKSQRECLCIPLDVHLGIPLDDVGLNRAVCAQLAKRLRHERADSLLSALTPLREHLHAFIRALCPSPANAAEHDPEWRTAADVPLPSCCFFFDGEHLYCSQSAECLRRWQVQSTVIPLRRMCYAPSFLIQSFLISRCNSFALRHSGVPALQHVDVRTLRLLQLLAGGGGWHTAVPLQHAAVAGIACGVV